MGEGEGESDCKGEGEACAIPARLLKGGRSTTSIVLADLGTMAMFATIALILTTASLMLVVGTITASNDCCVPAARLLIGNAQKCEQTPPKRGKRRKRQSSGKADRTG